MSRRQFLVRSIAAVTAIAVPGAAIAVDAARNQLIRGEMGEIEGLRFYSDTIVIDQVRAAHVTTPRISGPEWRRAEQVMGDYVEQQLRNHGIAARFYDGAGWREVSV